jgi:hypothetical protein
MQAVRPQSAFMFRLFTNNLLDDDVSSPYYSPQRRTVGCLMNNEGGTKWKEQFLVHFKAPSKDSPGGPEENHDVRIRSGHLQNTSQKRYRVSQLFDRF